MTKLIIIRGNSASGKTTLTKELKHQLGKRVLWLNQDLIRRQLLTGQDEAACQLLRSLLQYGQNKFDYIILEGILAKTAYAKLFELAVKFYGKEIYAYYFALPLALTLKRQQNLNQASLGEEELRKWFLKDDYLSNINEKCFSENDTLKSELNLILNDLFKKVS